MNVLSEYLTLEKPPKSFVYGTSGFRDHAETILPIVGRVGFVTVLKCIHDLKKDGNSLACGIMITASHNPAEDNGLKIVDTNGSMLPVQWESVCSTFVNAKGNDDVLQMLLHYHFSFELSAKCKVVIGMDTRPSCPKYKERLLALFDLLKVQVLDLGVVTTPQLHYAVFCLNFKFGENSSLSPELFLKYYYENFSHAFDKFNGRLPSLTINCCSVDVANGVGGVAMTRLKKHISLVKFDLANNGDGILNQDCGADFVVSYKKPSQSLKKNECYCSFDGDADRVVFYTCEQEDRMLLMDGDKITCLIIHTLKILLSKTGLNGLFRIAAVQTAYANGASTYYLTDVLNVSVICTSTGVKHLHRAAEEAADISVYFEANGHGTVLYSDAFQTHINAMESQFEALELELLKLVVAMTNNAIGDAITDLLLVLSCLNYLGWDMLTWSAIYSDWMSRLAKVKVADRYKIKVTNADRTIEEPSGMQAELDSLVATVNSASVRSSGNGDTSVEKEQTHVTARCFIRPSGTEDVVRIYAEAASQKDLDTIITGAQQLIIEYLS